LKRWVSGRDTPRRPRRRQLSKRVINEPPGTLDEELACCLDPAPPGWGGFFRVSVERKSPSRLARWGGGRRFRKEKRKREVVSRKPGINHSERKERGKKGEPFCLVKEGPVWKCVRESDNGKTASVLEGERKRGKLHFTKKTLQGEKRDPESRAFKKNCFS